MRPALTIAAIALGLSVVFAVMFGGNNNTKPAAPETPAAGLADNESPPADDNDTASEPSGDDDTTPADPDAGNGEGPGDVDTPEDAATPPPGDDGGTAGTDPDTDTDTDTEGDAAPDPDTEYRALFADTGEAGYAPITIGGIEEGTPFKLEAVLSPYRASLLDVHLTDYFERVGGEEHYHLLAPIAEQNEERRTPAIGSYAATALWIDGERVLLFEKDDNGRWQGGWNIAEQTGSSVTFTLTIASGPADAPTPVAEVTRVYHLDEGSYSLQVDQSVRNLTDRALRIEWEQVAQGDVARDGGDYLRGRSRQYILGYFNLKHDPGRFSISTDDGYIFRDQLVDKIVDGKWDSIWPNLAVSADQKELAWLASVNRYFAVVTSAHADPSTEESSDLTALEAVYPAIGTTLMPNADSEPDVKPNDRQVFFTLRSKPIEVPAGATTAAGDLGLDLFVGPRDNAVFSNAPYAAKRYDKLIRYSLGGPCGFCTFKWVADGLMALLKVFHWALGDWGVAIILLVLIVRLCLHPLTKRGQINMMKMSKQMAAIQPDIQKLKKKYADNPQKVQQEQMKLFREKGINPAAGALGCMPMFLQMPIWFALYAMLYYAIELRHEPAFYEFFQMFGGWSFLADLSTSDRFIPILPNDGTHVLALPFIYLDYSAINILPPLMAITFFFNMKFTTPPPANEQQAQQQKIMRIMPFLFPILLYSAPAGLTLYICASTAAGIIDSYIVRKHIKELEASGKLFEKKPPKPGGIMHKLQMAAQQAQEKQQQRAQADKQEKNRGPQNYKKRKR